MFIDILRSAENSAKVTKEIISYKADGNGVKTVKKELLNLAEVYKDNSINGLFADATEPKNNGIIIYKDFDPCLEVAKVWNTPTAEQMQKALQNYNGKMGTFSDFENMIKNTIAEGEHCLMAIESREGNQPTLKHYIDVDDTEAKCMWCGETADEGGFDVLYEILG